MGRHLIQITWNFTHNYVLSNVLQVIKTHKIPLMMPIHINTYHTPLAYGENGVKGGREREGERERDQVEGVEESE